MFFTKQTHSRQNGAKGDSDTSIASETVDLTNYEIDEFDDAPPDCCRNRCDQQSQTFVRRFVDSTFFNVFLSTTIMLNIVCLVIEVMIPKDQDSANSSWVVTVIDKMDSMDTMDVRRLMKRLDGIFLSVYLLEFLLKFYVSPVEYWRTWTNRLDFLILVFSFLQVAIDSKTGSSGKGSPNDNSGSDTSVSSILRTSTNFSK